MKQKPAGRPSSTEHPLNIARRITPRVQHWRIRELWGIDFSIPRTFHSITFSDRLIIVGGKL